MEVDFPNNWDGVVEKVMQYVNTQSFPAMQGAFTALRVIMRSYMFTDYDDRESRFGLHQIVSFEFPTLLAAYSALLEQSSVEAWDLLLTLNKIVFISVQIE